MSHLFHDELAYLRESGKAFARLNPRLAKYLSERSTDPDVERILEGFAFLTSRLREKLEDEHPEFTHSIIQLLWPNFLRPFPSAAMLAMTPIDRSITERHVIGKGTKLRSKAVQGIECQFQTTADCAVYPLDISSARLERTRGSTSFHIDFHTLSGIALRKIDLENLRLWFTDDESVAQTMYLWMRRYLTAVRVSLPHNDKLVIDLPVSSITPGGFASDEAILPQVSTAFEGYRLLQEYFFFPRKFYCLDINDLGRAFAGLEDTEFSIEFVFERPVPADIKLRPHNVRLYCVPIVNLFAHDSEPLIINNMRMRYRLVPSGGYPEGYEIFSVEDVQSWYPDQDELKTARGRSYKSFESFEHEIEARDNREQIYYRHRLVEAPASRQIMHFISFMLHNRRQAIPDEESLSVQMLCFNGALAAELGIGDIDIETEEAPTFASFTNITRPTPPVYPPLDGDLNWNLISNLALNYLSLLDTRALAQIIAVYDYKALADRQSERTSKLRADGIVAIDTRPIDKLFKGMPVRGMRSTIRMRESAFQNEGDMYLFASVLAEFFSLYSSINSFHELVVNGTEHGEVYEWIAKIGRQPLI